MFGCWPSPLHPFLVLFPYPLLLFLCPRLVFSFSILALPSSRLFSSRSFQLHVLILFLSIQLAGVKKWVEIDPWALQASDGGGSTAAHYAAKVALPLSYCAFILQCPKLLCLATQLPRDAQH